MADRGAFQRIRVADVWPEELLAAAPEMRDKTLFDLLFANGQVDQFPTSDMEEGYANAEADDFGFYIQKGWQALAGGGWPGNPMALPRGA